MPEERVSNNQETIEEDSPRGGLDASQKRKIPSLPPGIE